MNEGILKAGYYDITWLAQPGHSNNDLLIVRYNVCNFRSNFR